ncbi:GIN domain-containing protein [Phenylobacterium deserti]|uniref:Putative auto-transporter adhesin head GIN domain-containing protein n=1 Tax=Phenylobacterium deserti TaxID=1914756 RepID=A0A328AB77_9CAUL|nr:DUF2807 domain-containing protein [Phenylobacterium deserti]RAK52043.1 hypothetical protein DJ018_12850 [Phenylobacterium deserti]
MIRVLSMIAVTGFLLSVVCISAAIAIAGPDAVARGAWGWDWDRHDGQSPWEQSGHSGRNSETRDFTWTNGQRLAVSIPAEVRYVQADGTPRLTISDPANALDNVEVVDGEIRFRQGHPPMRRSLQVTLTAPGVNAFAVSGAGELYVDGYNQDRISVELSGSGEAEVRGAAKTLDLDIAGSAEADLGGLVVQDATVQISGSGEARIAPSESARLDISGSGEIDLVTNPRRLETNVSGSGSVNHEGGGAPQPPAPPRAPNAPRAS